MKKLIFFLLIIASLSAQGQKFNELINLERYAKANEELTASGVRPTVVFMGNSITQGWAKQRPDFFTTNNFTGRGISGQTTPQMLSRFREDVINLHPKAVVINAGVNDIAQNTGEYNAQFTLDNIKSMAELSDANGIKVILTSVLPAGGFLWNPSIVGVAGKIDALNIEIKAYAKSKGFKYIDYNSAMRDANGALKVEYGKDGVHPNGTAYQLMESIAMEVINKTVKK